MAGECQDKNENQIATQRGFPVYRTNPSVPSREGLPTRTRRITVPGGNGAVIVVTAPAN